MAKSIPIFEVVDSVQGSGGRPIHTRGAAENMVKAVDHSVDALQERMTDFIDGVQQMLAKGAEVAGAFQMETVEVEAAIGLEGKIGFLGTGTSAKGSAQIKIVFKRKNDPKPGGG